jgi:S1-C subfamily serine protease
MYYRGEGVAKDYKEAVRLFRQAADQGDAVAQSYLGLMYQKGEGVAKDAKVAVGWYRQAADLGNAWAQRNLGGMYYRGEGVAKDYKEAVRWSRLAADQGDARAQNNLGAMYNGGEGVAKDAKEAVRWYRLAADQGDAWAQWNLGACYCYGNGISKNVLFGYKWLLLARSNLDDKTLQRAVGIVESQLSPAQQAEGQRLAAAFSPKLENANADGGSGKSPMEIEGVSPGAPGAQAAPGEGQRQPGSEEPMTVYGTGFFISSNGTVVTAAHVVAKAKSMKARLSTGTVVPLRVLRVNEKLDLAVLQADLAGSPPPSTMPIASSYQITLGQPVMTIGFPNPGVQGMEPKYTQGTVSALTGVADNPNTLQISVPVQPGNSGGALVDMAGRVIGVVVSRLDAVAMVKLTGALSENTNYAVKSSHVLTMLPGLPAANSLPVGGSSTPPATADDSTIQRLKQSSVLITVERE